jgi:hypothetical protein
MSYHTHAGSPDRACALAESSKVPSPIQVAILQLVEKGLLTLDTPVDEWLPEMAKLKIISEWKDGEPTFVEPQAKITIQVSSRGQLWIPL